MPVHMHVINYLQKSDISYLTHSMHATMNPGKYIIYLIRHFAWEWSSGQYNTCAIDNNY